MTLRPSIGYAVLGAAIAIVSSAAVVTSVRPASARPAASATPGPSSTARAAPELSKAARLAFWREGRLWVSDLDGSLRRTVTSAEDVRRVSLTRWSLDGGALAFVDSSLSLSVVSLDGAKVDVDLPIEVRNAGYRIADIRWSPDGRTIAATLLRPGDGRADAFVVDLAASRPAWSRLTSLGDAFVADWISGDELLAYTGGGAVGILSARAPDAMRLLSGVQGVSPVLGPSGRIYYLVGTVPNVRDPATPYVAASRASVWSVRPDGSDPRRESTWALDEVRLDAVLPDDRYLVHVGSGRSAQAIAAGDVALLPVDVGIVERVRVAPDGRIAFGFTDQRIVRVDLAKVPIPPSTSAPGAVSVFLDGVGGGDVWFPAPPALAVASARPAGPDAALVFRLGAHVWKLEDGVTTLLRAAPALRRAFTPVPRWSPNGERLLVIEQAGVVASSTTFVAYLLDRDGRAMRLDATQGAARSFAWSPSGDEVAIVVDSRGVSGIASDASLEVRFFGSDGRQTRPAIDGREVAWTAKGLLAIRTVDGIPSVVRMTGEASSDAKTLLSVDRVAADARAQDPQGGTPVTLVLSGLDAAPGSGSGSVQLRVLGVGASRSYVVVFDADGKLVQYLRSDNVTDVAWSPKGDVIGYTVDASLPGQRALVSTVEGRVLAAQAGRFGGWSPDGTAMYVARAEGVFAYPLSGGDPARVGPGGAPLTATGR